MFDKSVNTKIILSLIVVAIALAVHGLVVGSVPEMLCAIVFCMLGNLIKTS